MSKFKAGDKVKVVARSSDQFHFSDWYTEGAILTITSLEGSCYYVSENSFKWHEVWLELIEAGLPDTRELEVGDTIMDEVGDYGVISEISSNPIFGWDCKVELTDLVKYKIDTIIPYSKEELVLVRKKSKDDVSGKVFEGDGTEEEVGLKKDHGKVQMDLLPVRFLEEVSRVLTFGANKYHPYNWSKGIEFSRLFAALLRHIYAFWRGEDSDSETGLSHLAHAACCLAFMFELLLIDKGWDDRPVIYKKQGE